MARRSKPVPSDPAPPLAPGDEVAPPTPTEAAESPPGHDGPLTASAPAHGPLIVGLGGSAGSLEALLRFFRALPAEVEAAFVVVTHMAPDFESRLPELLQPATPLRVRQVHRRTRVRAGHVYVVPPGQSIELTNGHLRVRPFERPEDRRAPIDHFFRTLGDVHPGSVGIVLSGSGSDGSVGIGRIKETAGLLLAQAPADAEYDAMPRAALATGLVDAVLPADDLARRVAAYAEALVTHGDGAAGTIPDEPDPLAPTDAEALAAVLGVLRAEVGHDFSHYKRATVLRRIARRMLVHGLSSLTDYATFLSQTPEEPAALLGDLLISVTHFFRDREAWAALERDVLPTLLRGKNGTDTVRVWSAGCATGEEAYGLAMLLAEACARLPDPPQFQVFATDMDEDALVMAREGEYPAAIEADVSEERLARFFQKTTTHYRVKKSLRERVLFAAHSLVRDTPFSRLDLVACRNLLIYLQREVQGRAFGLLHYALRPDGVLFLGSSESAEGATDLFRPLHAKHRLYVRRTLPHPSRLPPGLPMAVPEPLRALPALPPAEAAGALHRRLLEAFAPPSLLVDAQGEVIHLSETAGRYLRVPGGAPTANAFRSLRPELVADLRIALPLALGEGRTTTSPPVLLRLDGADRAVHLHVRPAPQVAPPDGAPPAEPLALVVFVEGEPDDAVPPSAEAVSGAAVQRLETALDHARDRLQTKVEEYEATVEELRASNEELQSMNEEFRSATEELETSREELQSVNEELATVNQELKGRVDETTRMHSSLEHLMASTDIGTLFLNRELRVGLYTPRVALLFNVLPSDRGRPLTHLTHRFTEATMPPGGLTPDAAEVLRTLLPIERELDTRDGETFAVSFRPYRSAEDRIEGVVMTFVDVTQRKKAEADLRDARQSLEVALDAADLGTWDLDLATGRARTSLRHNQIFGFAEPVAAWGPDLLRQQVLPEDHAALDAALARALKTGLFDLEVRFRRQDGAVRWVHDWGRVHYDEAGTAVRMSGVIQDTTDARADAEALRQSEERYRTLFESIDEGFALCEMVRDEDSGLMDCRYLEVNPAFEKMTGLAAADVVGRRARELFPAIEEAWIDTYRRVVETGEPLRFEQHIAALDQWYEVYAFPQGGDHFAGIFTDVTERKAADAALRESEERYRSLFATAPTAVFVCDRDAVIQSYNRLAAELWGREPVCGVEQHCGSVKLWLPDGTHLPHAHSPMMEVLRTGTPALNVEVFIERPDGSRLPVLANFAPLRDGDGEISGAITSFIDISERKATEEALRQSEARFRLASSNEVLTLYEQDLALRYTWVHPQHPDFPEANIGKTDAELVPGGGGEVLMRVKQRVLDTGRGAREEVRVTLPSGVRWYDLVTEPRRDDSGRITGIAGVALDVSERKQAEEALRTSEERYHLLVESATEYAILALAPDGTITAWNAGAERVCGYTAAEAIGQPGALIFTEEDRAAGAPEHEVETARREGRAADERWHRRKDGSRFWGSGVLNAVRSDGVETEAGPLVGFVKVFRDVTAQREAAEALRASEERYRTFLELSVESIWRFDLDEPVSTSLPPDEQVARMFAHGWLAECNAATARMYGYERPEEIVGARLTEFLDPADPRNVAYLRAFVDSGYRLDGAESHETDRDGRPLVFLNALTGQVQSTDTGEVMLRAWGTQRDVTAQRAAEAALRENEEQYRLLLTNVREYAIFTLDEAGRVTTWNAGAERILGYTEAEMLGHPRDVLYTEEDRAAGMAAQRTAKAVAEGQAHDERWFVRKDGERFWSSGILTALHDADGRLRGFIKILRDLTAAKTAEEAIRESEGRFRQLAEAMPQIVYTTDTNGRLDYLNERWTAYTGQPTVKALEHGQISGCLHPDDRDPFAATWAAALAFGGPLQLEARLRRADGMYRWYLLRAIPIKDAEGAVVRWFGTGTDIHEQKEAEARLQAFNEELETRVAERTVELAQKTEDARALTAALTLAEQRERHRIAEVLHDHVQQLLYAAQIRLHLLSTTAPAALPEQVEGMRAMLDEALQTTRTLTVDLSPPVLRDEGLADALRWLAAQMEETHGLHVEVEAEGDVTPPEDRRILLFQLVRELLFNVAKHAGTGQARVRVREVRTGGTKGRGRKGRALEVHVEDDGAGFDAQAVRARAGESGGFGLFSVQERLDLLGGTMTVTSAPGQGTHVAIMLPM